MPVIQARVTDREDRIIKELAKSEGLSVSELLKVSVLGKAEKHSRSSFYGSMASGIRVSEDFDEPIDDLREYM